MRTYAICFGFFFFVLLSCAVFFILSFFLIGSAFVCCHRCVVINVKQKWNLNWRWKRFDEKEKSTTLSYFNSSSND